MILKKVLRKKTLIKEKAEQNPLCFLLLYHPKAKKKNFGRLPYARRPKREKIWFVSFMYKDLSAEFGGDPLIAVGGGIFPLRKRIACIKIFYLW